MGSTVSRYIRHVFAAFLLLSKIRHKQGDIYFNVFNLKTGLFWTFLYNILLKNNNLLQNFFQIHSPGLKSSAVVVVSD